MTITGPASSTGTLSWEVMKVEGTKATLKTTTAMGSAAGTESTTMIDLSQKDPYAAATASGTDMKVEVTGTSSESVTTPAGTFLCVKTTSKVTSSQGGATSTSNTDSWSSAQVGLVKSVSVTKLDLAVPGGLPGGLSSETRSELVLKSFTR